ncbi:MAG: MMPL family transporter [Bauldia sp.]|nr:MMPL family transporter [Bauldia sp.]
MNSLGFGLERIVAPVFRWPRASGLVVLILLGLCAYGGSQLSFDQNLRAVFAGGTEAYKVYSQTVEDFVDPENEILILVEGKRLAEPEVFAKLRDFQFELQFIDGVGSVVSAFALRQPPDANGDAPLLIDNAEAGLSPELLDKIRSHPLFGSKLLSTDGTAMNFIVTPSEPKAPLAVTRVLRQQIEQTAKDILGDTGLEVTVSGFPVLRLDIVDVLIHDQILLNTAGVIIGIIMSLIVFRSVIASVMTAVPAIIAGGSVLGMIGLLGTQITVMSNVVPALIMVLGYADAMHLTFAWRRYRAEGADPKEAARLAEEEVGAACILTAITTALAFLSLTLSDVEIVSRFAWIGAIGAVLGGMLVLAVHSLLAIYLGRFWNPAEGTGRSLLAWLRGPNAAIGRFSVRHARGIAVVAGIMVVVLGVMYFSVPPQHSLREHLPSNNPANAALGRIDKLFDGAYPIQIVVPLGDASPTSPEGLEKIRAVHEAVAGIKGVQSPLSLWSVAEWLGGTLQQASEKLTELAGEMPPETASRFFGREGESLVTVNVHEMTTSEAKPLIDEIEAAARKAGGPGVQITGVTVLTARESDRTINNLFWSLTLAVVAGVGAIMLAFRDWRMGVVALLPNALPIFATGAILFIVGAGMQFTSVLSLTVAFGIAVDDTIHYLNRFRLSGASLRLPDRLVDTSRHIGPVLVGTTAIIIAGLSTTFVSEMPTIKLFGELATVTLAVALLADLLVLPALMAGVAHSWFETKKSKKDEKSAAQDEPVQA